MTPRPLTDPGRKTRKGTPKDDAAQPSGRRPPAAGGIWRQLRIERLRITDKAALHPAVRDLS
jgi:hypothetical protein